MGKTIFRIGLLSFLVCSVLSYGSVVAAQQNTGPPSIVDIDATLNYITNWLFGILILVAVVMLVFAGFQFATAAGNADKIKSARNMIIYALVGVVVAFASKGLVAIVQKLIVGGRSI